MLVIALDRSVVAGVGRDRVLATLVRSLVQFAGGSGAMTVAEGIEAVDAAYEPRRPGVDYGQVWLFGRSVSAARTQIVGVRPSISVSTRRTGASVEPREVITRSGLAHRRA